jgi:hypothetical protein
LGITKHKLHKYETGREVMPTDLLVKIMSAGMFVFRK